VLSFISSQINHGVNINYGKVIFKNQNQNNKMEKLASLLEYAPSNFLDKVIKKLEEYKIYQMIIRSSLNILFTIN